ncbi:MAG: autotransporter outer membrane beta-barrel domain-containing protein [Rhodocyclaceae bacterium]|nr:autotransporter outer membrane beta-barrel domain-containing protein [Rhodocyclaceae bacterium]
MKRHLLRGGVAVAVTTLSSAAWATPCDSALSSYESYVSSNLPFNAAQIVSNHPECFAGSPSRSLISFSTTSLLVFYKSLTILAMRRMFALRSSNAPFMSGDSGQTGMAAGGSGGKWNFWSNLTRNDTSQTYLAANGFRAKNEADVTTVVLGGDYALSKDLTFGVSAAYDDGAGGGSNRSPGSTPNGIQTDGYLISPYLGWQFGKHWSLDASAGFGRGRLETTTNTDSKANRWFAGGSLNYERWVGNWQFGGQASLLHAVEDNGDMRNSATGAKFVGTDARNTLDQLRLGVQAGYWLNGMMPYASLAYVSDVGRKTTQFGVSGNPIGRDAWVAGIGVNFFSVKDGVTGGIGYNQEFGRNNQNNYSLTANLNVRF